MAKRTLLADEKRYRALAVLFNGCVIVEKKSPEEIGRVLGDVSGSSIRRYLKNPENMRLKDLNRMGRLLGADIEQLRNAAIRY